MERIIYTDVNGESIRLDKDSTFRLKGKSGFETTTNKIEYQQVYGMDGANLISDNLDIRDMTISGEIIPEHRPNYNHEDLLSLREDLIRIMNPKKAGTLKYINNIGEYQIDVIPISAPIFQEEKKTYKLPFLIQLVALDPYWADATYIERLIPLSRTVSLFEWPLEITKEFEFATIESGNIERIVNHGDVDVGVIFKIKAYGNIVNPRIYNVLTQEYFGFKGTYQAGTEFKIDTRRGHKKVAKIKEGLESNAMSEREYGSTFLVLKQGDNYLQAQADEDTVNNLLVDITLKPLVVGV